MNASEEKAARIAAGEEATYQMFPCHGIWVYVRIGQDVYITDPIGHVTKEAV